MRILILASICLVACAHADSVNPTVINTDTECVFTFVKLPSCSFKTENYNLIVILHTKPIANDEIKLTQATIDINGNLHTLKISKETFMIQGNLGKVLFDDINFDGIPDLAISTSFGVANQYLDYWIYDKNRNRYTSIGNLPRLFVNKKQKILLSQVKINAANYETQSYSWNEDKLIKNE